MKQVTSYDIRNKENSKTHKDENELTLLLIQVMA